MAGDKTVDIWEMYTKEKDESKKKAIKNILIEEYVNLVKIISGKLFVYYAQKHEYEDLVGYGIIGLIDAIDRFDPSKNIKFETYATIRIRGSIMDQIRKLDWIPRTVRAKSKQVESAQDELSNILGRAPSKTELADYLDISMDELENMLDDSNAMNIVSIEDDLIDIYNNQSAGSRLMTEQRIEDNPEEQMLKNDTVDQLAKAIDRLGKQEKIVINLYYYENLTYKEISKVLELSESRISQIVSKSLSKLKKEIEGKI